MQPWENCYKKKARRWIKKIQIKTTKSIYPEVLHILHFIEFEDFDFNIRYKVHQIKIKRFLTEKQI